MENKNSKIIWDFIIQCIYRIENKKPDIVFIEEGSRLYWFIDTPFPIDKMVFDKEGSNDEMLAC